MAKGENMQRLIFGVSDEVKDKLDNMARETRRSMASLILFLLETHPDLQTPKQRKAAKTAKRAAAFDKVLP